MFESSESEIKFQSVGRDLRDAVTPMLRRVMDDKVLSFKSSRLPNFLHFVKSPYFFVRWQQEF